MCSSLPASKVWICLNFGEAFRPAIVKYHFSFLSTMCVCVWIYIHTLTRVECSVQGKQRTRVQMKLTLMFIHSIEIALQYSKTRGTKRSTVDMITHTRK